MTPTKLKPRMSITRHGLWSPVVLSLALLVGCGDGGPSVPRGTGGTGGTGASGGVGAMGGNGTGGMVGTGGTGGTGGMVGTGGTGGSAAGGGAGGGGGALGPCDTNALCHTCPDDDFPCDPDDGCAFSGYVCVDSGCDTHQGAPIKRCQPSRGGSCTTVSQCPNATDYECMKVGAGGNHCVRVSPGCGGATESYDCPFGFSCESNTCVDRRVPCDDYLDCPRNHVCRVTPTANFCVRTHQTCHRDEDCAGLGEFCADIDGDGSKECAGEFEASGAPCVSAGVDPDCTGPTPVCEAGATGVQAMCGDYGLCLTNGDCDEANDFHCVALWQDERKECVPTGGTCVDDVTQCDPQQVCAAPRNSPAPPSCQTGSVP